MLNPLAWHARRVGTMFCLLLSGAAIASALVVAPGSVPRPMSTPVRLSTRTSCSVTMCGIVAVFDTKLGADKLEALTKELTSLLDHRGPDEVGYHGGPGFGLGHARLSIMDPNGGHQPLISKATGAAVIHNGEIYNHADLRARSAREREAAGKPAYEFLTGSDSESVLPFFEDLGEGCVPLLDGMFSVVVVSADGQKMVACRDPCGIKPLYRGWNADGRVMFASELKCLVGQAEQVEEFPPGHYWTPDGGYKRYFAPRWFRPLLPADETPPPEPEHADEPESALPRGDTKRVREVLKAAVKKRLMSDVDYGLLLSGGLDSAIVCRLMSELTDMSKIKSFTVGMRNSPDITAARAVADFFGTDHYEYLFTPEEAFSIVPKVIYHLETYEPELIRSSIPNFFLARLAGAHLKVVLTGEGADELFAGYLYFRDCPSRAAMQSETLRIFDHLHSVNLQRSDRMGMAHGVEARVPFLDVDMLAEAYGSVDPSLKMHSELKMEKWALRELFDGSGIPEDVIWRTKAMQCEGVGTDWVSILQSMCEDVVSDEEFATAAELFPKNTPHSKEEFYYRRLFDEHFSGFDKFVHVWEGGCRAGGAPWKSSAYTRAGLVDTEQLRHGLMDDDANVPIEDPTPVAAPSPGTSSPVMSVAALERTEARRAQEALQALRSKPRTTAELLVGGGDSRLTVLDTGANAYHCPPQPVPKAIIRGSCTGSPPTPGGFAAAEAARQRIGDARDAKLVGDEMEAVRARLMSALALPEGTALVLAASGTCAELIPLAVARELHPTAPICSVVAAEGETGAGGATIAAGRYFNTQVPLASTPRTVGAPVPGFGTIEVLAIPARTPEGEEADTAAALKAAMDADFGAVADADAEPPAWVLRQVIGTKTGFATDPLRDSLGIGVDGGVDADRVIDVVDLCQLRRPLGEVAEHVKAGACVLMTGSKFFQGTAFSAAVAIPPSLVARMRANVDRAPPLPRGLRDFISQHEVPTALSHWRSQLSSQPNEGLLLRWHTALPHIEAVAGIEHERAIACERVWVRRIEELVAAAPGLEVFHEESGIVSIALRRADGRLAVKDELRQVHKWMAADLSGAPGASNCDIAATPVFIGQPVVVGDFAIVRLALGADLLVDLHEGSLHEPAEDAAVVAKLAWVNANFDALYNWGGANLNIDLSGYVGDRAATLTGNCGALPARPDACIGTRVEHAKAALSECDAICFDVDSTIITHEIIVEMAERLGVGDKVRAMTLKAMGGDVPFHEALAHRLDLMRPSVCDLDAMKAEHAAEAMLSPGVLECLAILQRRGVRIFFVSGGFRQMIEPIAEACGVAKTDIYSNTLLFNDDGSFKSHDPREPTSRAGGKAKVVSTLKREYGFKQIVMVGDGATDMEARDVEGGADAFIGFGGCKVRTKVKHGADWFIHSFSELIEVLRED